MACGIFLDQGLNLCPFALAGEFLPLDHWGSLETHCFREEDFKSSKHVVFIFFLLRCTSKENSQIALSDKVIMKAFNGQSSDLISESALQFYQKVTSVLKAFIQ